MPLAETFGYHTVATVGGIVFIFVALLPLSERLVRQLTPENIRTHNLEAGQAEPW